MLRVIIRLFYDDMTADERKEEHKLVDSIFQRVYFYHF